MDFEDYISVTQSCTPTVKFVWNGEWNSFAASLEGNGIKRIFKYISFIRLFETLVRRMK
jgi:hypothetical protein